MKKKKKKIRFGETFCTCKEMSQLLKMFKHTQELLHK